MNYTKKAADLKSFFKHPSTANAVEIPSEGWSVYYQELYQECSDTIHSLVFFTTPTLQPSDITYQTSFSQHRPPSTIMIGPVFSDHVNDKLLQEKNWGDEIHLKKEGASIFTQWLADQIIEHWSQILATPWKKIPLANLRMIISCFIFFSLALSCIANAEPSAEDLLREARLRPTTHPITLAAEIRGAEEPLPLTFKIGKGQIEYQLHNPEETILLKLGTNNSSLSETKKGTSNLVTSEKRYQEIRNTGVTYDDLSLGFLYWPHPRLTGSQQLRGTKASIIELIPPSDDQGPYGSARIWIDQASGAPLRMEGFDKNGNLLKRFEVISAQKIDDLWTLKEMRIETFDPQTHSVTQRRYLTIHRDSK